jgi:hypothetical protein
LASHLTAFSRGQFDVSEARAGLGAEYLRV